jgi:hypothetical protein
MAELEVAKIPEGKGADLAERLRFTSGVTEACHLVLEAVLRSEDVDRAVIAGTAMGGCA